MNTDNIYKELTATEREKWHLFCDYLKYNRRFLINKLFLQNDSILQDPHKLFNKIKINLTPNENYKFYRARIGYSGVDKHDKKQPFPPSEMGRPPIEKCTTPYRANPIGISYLYLASNIETALKEVRAKEGDYVTIAEIKIVGRKYENDTKLEIIDLTKANSLTEEEIGSDTGILKAFANHMSLPIEKDTAPIDYVPTQFLSELIKDLNYDGIKYKSSLSDKNGVNYVLFQQSDSAENIKNFSPNDGSVFIKKTFLVRVNKIGHTMISGEIENELPLIPALIKSRGMEVFMAQNY